MVASLKPAICNSFMHGIDVNLHHVASNMSSVRLIIQAFDLNPKGEMALGIQVKRLNPNGWVAGLPKIQALYLNPKVWEGLGIPAFCLNL